MVRTLIRLIHADPAFDLAVGPVAKDSAAFGQDLVVLAGCEEVGMNARKA